MQVNGSQVHVFLIIRCAGLGIEAVREYTQGGAAFIICSEAYGASVVVVPVAVLGVIVGNDHVAVLVVFVAFIIAADEIQGTEQLIFRRGQIV